MTSTSDPSDSSATRRPLLVFFSRPGENYWAGGRRNLEIGNTKVVAEMISERIDCDTYEILAADPYPEAYDPTVERGRQEQNDNARPEIDGDPPDLSGYRTVLIGCPLWHMRAPMIIRSFLDQTSALAGKTVHPFFTYGAEQGSVIEDYRELCPKADVREGLAIRGEDVEGAANEVEAWLDKSGLR